MTQRNHHSTSSHSREQGFALIVVAALLVAFALVAGTMVDRHNADHTLVEQQTSRTDLSRISQALVQYALFNQNRFPCPAADNVAVGDVTFGEPVANCATNATGLTVLSGSTEVIRGIVPVKALMQFGLSENDAFDSWNNRIMYVVNRNLTPGATVQVTTRPQVQAAGGTPISPDFVLISYGKDGLGAIPRAQTAPTIACPGSGSDPRKQNCDNNLQFAEAPANIAAGTEMANYADDLLSYYKFASCPAQLMTWGTGGECKAMFPATTSGYSSGPITRDPALSTVNYDGTGTAMCNGNSWGPVSGSCAALPTLPGGGGNGNGCSINQINWGSNCKAGLPAGTSGQCVSVMSTVSKGTATAVCDGNSWQVIPGACVSSSTPGNVPYPACP